ncbi:MAG: sulfotransferase domain-containing protein [Bacteroidales bacterium]|jgi:hypothetical protein|nr:sulfotransferase domain-containing protein [Bacteroidales bacterium]
MKRRIKGLIKQLLPYFIVQYYMRKKAKGSNFNKIWANYNGQPLSLPPITQTFKYVISVHGFGHSGSGAIIDLLREIPKATVLGGVDSNGSNSNPVEAFPEFDIIRVAGGLFEMEKLIDSSANIFINDALINRFIDLLDHSYYLYSVKHREIQILLLNFMSKIIDFSISVEKECFNLHLKSCKKNPVIYFLKTFSKEEYISYCSELLQSIFSLLGTNHLLVLDQLFSGMENKFAYNRLYVPNLKTIVIQRDPRDVFTTGLILKNEWVPYSDVVKFVKWYSLMIKNYPYIDSDILNLKFEDLVINYDVERKKILDFLGLDINDHENIKTKFVPERSIKNIGLWKNRKDIKEQISYIENKLDIWCYNA